MFDIICTLPLPSDLFAQVLHPTEPLLTIGLASGHVQSYRLPATEEYIETDAGDDDHPQKSKPSLINGTTSHSSSKNSGRRRSWSESENGLGSVEKVWATRRHKGSCRCLTLNHDGSLGYSAGTDRLVKAFSTETGRVTSKIAFPGNEIHGRPDTPCEIHALSPQSLLLATDFGKVYLHDLRSGGREVHGRASQTWFPHEGEQSNSLIPLPPSEASTSGFSKQWISVGGTTVTVMDLRKGIIAKSEPQETELMSAIFVQGLKKGGTSVGEKLLVGQEDGVISLWEKGVWDDLDDRIVVDTGNMIWSLCEVPEELASGLGNLLINEKLVASGLESGSVQFVKIGMNGVLPEFDVKHDEIEGVVALDFDVVGRMVTGGGQTVKVWTKAKGKPGGGRSSPPKQDTRKVDDESDSEDSSRDTSESEEEAARARQKRRKGNKGRTVNGARALNFSGTL